MLDKAQTIEMYKDAIRRIRVMYNKEYKPSWEAYYLKRINEYEDEDELARITKEK